LALLEGVVVAPRLGLAYVMRPGGGLDALDLASGAVRWRSDSAAKPLALAGQRLIAQAESGGANVLKLVSLDARSGAARETVRIDLPAGVAAPVVDSASGSFRVQADASGSELAVRWEATGVGAPAQGVLPAENEGQAPVVVAGEAVVDLGSSLRVKTEPSVRSMRSPTLARAALQELPASAVAGAQGRQLLSADGRHVLVTEPIEGAGLSLYRHQWTIYERASGARLGSVSSLVSATPFVVVGRTLYQVEPAHAVRREGGFAEHPAALRAVSLTTGAEEWRTAIRETAFSGPFVP
jgi:hypothetical protein